MCVRVCTCVSVKKKEIQIVNFHIMNNNNNHNIFASIPLLQRRYSPEEMKNEIYQAVVQDNMALFRVLLSEPSVDIFHMDLFPGRNNIFTLLLHYKRWAMLDWMYSKFPILNGLEYQVNNQDRTCFDLAIQHGQIKFLQRYATEFKTYVENEDKEMLMIHAIDSMHYETFDFVFARVSAYITPIHSGLLYHAVKKDNLWAIQCLLDAGYSPNFIHPVTKNSVLHEVQSVAALRLLLYNTQEKVDTTVRNDLGFTPLHYSRHRTITQELIQYDPEALTPDISHFIVKYQLIHDYNGVSFYEDRE